jgi:hypothetical protein
MFDIDELEAEDGRAIYVQLANPLFGNRRAARRGEARVASR